MKSGTHPRVCAARRGITRPQALLPRAPPQIIRALFQAIYALQVLRQREKRLAAMPEKAGVSWTAEEDERLVAQAEAGVPIDQLARAHQRTARSIHARLAKLGKASSEETSAL